MCSNRGIQRDRRICYLFRELDCTGIEMKVLENYRILYRIKDLVKSLTKDVVNGRKKINSDRFKNILKK